MKSAASATPDLRIRLHWYRQMFLLRRFELTAQECYRRGEMPGFIHLYVGQEAVAAGVCAHLPLRWSSRGRSRCRHVPHAAGDRPMAWTRSDRGAPVAAMPTPASASATACALAPSPAEGNAFIMPHGDLTDTEATIVNWLKQVGDRVKTGEAVVEVETAKSILSVDSPFEGELIGNPHPPVDTVVKLGQQLAVIRSK